MQKYCHPNDFSHIRKVHMACNDVPQSVMQNKDPVFHGDDYPKKLYPVPEPRGMHMTRFGSGTCYQGFKNIPETYVVHPAIPESESRK